MQEGGNFDGFMTDFPMLPSFMGGETAAQQQKGLLNLQNTRKRKSDQAQGTAELNPASAMTRTEVLEEEPLGKTQKIFTTYEEIGVQEVKLDPVQSQLRRGKIVFQPLPSQNQFTNPSHWGVKLRLHIDRADAGNAAYADPDAVVAPAAPATGSFHLRLANRAQAFMFKKTSVVFNNTVDVNQTHETEDFNQFMTWAISTTPEEKNDWKSRYEQLCHSNLCGSGISRVGRHRANAALELSADLPKYEWGGRECEELLHSLQADHGNGVGFDLVISPLPGPFFMLNQYLPGTFTPKIELNLRILAAELPRWLIVREANAARNGGGAAPANAAAAGYPRVRIIGDYTKLLVPYKTMNTTKALALEKKFFEHQMKPYATEKMVRSWVSNTFNITDNRNTVGLDLDGFEALKGNVPDQFAIGFIRDGYLRGGDRALNTEKMLMNTSHIDRVQIFLGEDAIFEEGPLDWRNNAKNNHRLWQMQCDFWGKEGNPDRKNAVCQDPDDFPHGQKWVWCVLNPNANGGFEAIERLDKTFSVRVWGDGNLNGIRFIMWIPESANFVCNNAISNDWVGPEYPVVPAHYVRRPVCYNARGGRQWV